MTEKVLVVIPAYNEVETISELVHDIRKRLHLDVLVIDDGSTDKTGLWAGGAGAHVIEHSENTHIAQSIIDGFDYAERIGYDRVVTIDAGGSHNPNHIPKLLAAHAHLVIGTRTFKTNVPKRRELLSNAAREVMWRLLSGPGVRPKVEDPTSGFRVYSRLAYRTLLARRNDGLLRARSFDWQLESLFWLDRLQPPIAIAQVPISYAYTNSSLRARVLWDAAKSVVWMWRQRRA